MARVSRWNLGSLKRPTLEIPPSALERALDGLSLLGVVIAWGVTLWSWQSLPDQIPIHFNLAGEVDGWGRRQSILNLPAVATVLPLLLWVLRRFPDAFNYPWPITLENAADQYGLARLVLASLGFAIVSMVLAALAAVFTAARRGHLEASWLLASIAAAPLVVLVSYWGCPSRC